MALARDFWRVGEGESATQEMALAQELDMPQVLGVSIRQEENQRYWKEIVKDYPDYRDAYIQLASIAYEKGNKDEAREYIKSAVALDPNNPIVKKLEDFISPSAQ